MLLALAGDGACNIGIDNAACLATSLQLLALAAASPLDLHSYSAAFRTLQRTMCTNKLPKPWKQQRNGDLHRAMFEFLRATNPASVKLTKVRRARHTRSRSKWRVHR